MPELPPGQRARQDFPRFGLAAFVDRCPEPAPLGVQIKGQVDAPFALDGGALHALRRTEQTSDLHCVTTWTAPGLRWGGWRFKDIWEQCLAPRVRGEVRWLLVRSADGFRARLPLDDMLADDVMLADELGGEPLPLIHGGPLRLVAPRHYGYKNPKHVVGIELAADCDGWRSPTAPWTFMEHPRARVALEERGRGIPGVVLRWLYRPLVEPTVRQFAAAWSAHHRSTGDTREA